MPLLFLLFPFFARAEWMDRSHTIFLPPQIRENLGLQMEFSNTWWNFAVISPVNGISDFQKAQDICHKLDPLTGHEVQKTGCPNIKSFQPIIADWARDLSRRETAPDASRLRNALNVAKAKASLPMDRELLEVLRADPLESYENLKHLMMKNVELGLKQERGFFVDSVTGKIAVPIQMGFSPQDTAQTKKVKAALASEGVVFVGPHMSAAENESQILEDVDIISVVGTLILLLQIGFIIATKRYKYFWLIPPVVLGVGGAIGLTVLIFGSIHGLTLSLGTGIIGLALDFGLHSAHNINWKGVWRANLFGLLTTFAGLLAIVGSPGTELEFAL